MDHSTADRASTAPATNTKTIKGETGRATNTALSPRHESLAAEFLPLARAQRGMWVAERIQSKGAVYNLGEYCEIFGPIDESAFIDALYQVAEESDTARVQIIETEDGPRQAIMDCYHGHFPMVDFSNHATPLQAAEQWMLDEIQAPTDIATDPLWGGALIKLADDHYCWFHRVHHVVIDGFGGGLMARRLAEVYNHRALGTPLPPCPFLPLHEQLAQETSYRESKRFERDKQYWSETLSGIPDPISLSRNGGMRSGGLLRSRAPLRRDIAERLSEIGQEVGASLPQVLIALIGAYYYRSTGQEDLVLGMPVSARVNKTLRQIPSMMANAVSIRLALSPEMSLTTLIEQVAKTVRSALRHQQYRYEDLRRDLGLLGQNQQISWLGVNIEPFDYDLGFGGHRTAMRNLSNGSIEDLTIFVFDRGTEDGMSIDLDANPGLYSQAELDDHRDRLMRMIAQLVERPDESLMRAELLSADEYRRIVTEWNDTARPLPDTSLPQLFAEQAADHATRIAIATPGVSFSYRELDTLSSQLAAALQQRGIGPGSLVATALPRDAWLSVGLMAIMKSGAAYLPLDPSAPEQRNTLILDEAKADLLLVGNAAQAALSTATLPTTTLSQLRDAAPENIPQLPALDPQSPAYVIFTSGSTGRPKGVVVTHRNLLNFLLSMQDHFRLSPDNALLGLTTIAFDIAALELYLPLMCGARVELVDRETAKDPDALARHIVERGVSHVQATPSHWQALLADHAAALKGIRALVGGEALPSALAHKMRQLGHPVTNLYGPTETTIWSTMMELDGNDLDSPPIGRPIWNTQVYVLDAALQPVPVGAVGELYIAGEGVANGYLHRQELTAERFLANPFGAGRLYKTGDQARWRHDGVLEYLGRNDFQIKIRGFRVESDEIESAMITLPAIQQTAIALHQDPAGNKRLIGYIVPTADADAEALSPRSLRGTLSRLLPDYMVPALFVQLDALPLNVNGKLDRKALPEPAWQAQHEYVAPRTEAEIQLAAIWSELFGIEKISVHDNFFDLGGDSLMAARLIAKLRDITQRNIPLAAIFAASTVADLAEQLEQYRSVDPLGPLIPFNERGQGPAVFCIHPVVGLSWAYGSLSHMLGSDISVYGLQARGFRDASSLPGSIEEMARDYLQQMRACQPDGPYRLVGGSMGGLVAHEVARLLREDGEELELLAILDAFPCLLDDAMQQRNEAELAADTLAFLGIESREIPSSIDELTDILCREYDIFNLPELEELQQSNEETLANMVELLKNNITLMRNFVPQYVDVDIQFFHAAATAENPAVCYEPEGWQPYVRAMTVHSLDCHHQQMLDADIAAKIAPRIASVLPARRSGAAA